MVPDVLLKTLKSLNLSYPIVSKKRKAELKKTRRQLQQESDKESKYVGDGENKQRIVLRAFPSMQDVVNWNLLLPTLG